MEWRRASGGGVEWNDGEFGHSGEGAATGTQRRAEDRGLSTAPLGARAPSAWPLFSICGIAKQVRSSAFSMCLSRMLRFRPGRRTLMQVLEGNAKNLGDSFTVTRTLPQRIRRAVGPFVFWDEMGPATMSAGTGLDVPPHPHIGLATITFLFEGALMHRDSLGVEQRIVPGDVNLMTAGSGIAHSERTPSDLRTAGHRLHGIQAWLALPQTEEERPASFSHIESKGLPLIARTGARIRLIAGTAFGERSPVPVFSPTLYCDVELDAGASLSLESEHPERAVYLVRGELEVDGQAIERGSMAVVPSETKAILRAGKNGAHAMLLGGAPLDGKRHMFWNFVSSRRERIEEAKRDWWRASASGFTEGPFRLPPGESEFIALEGEPAAGPPPCTREQPTT